MKKLLILFLAFLGLSYTVVAQSTYDEALAKKLGADERGMKKYVMAFLLRGDRVAEYTPEQRQEILAGHMANIQAYATMGKLQIAGPFMDDGDWRGIFILDVPAGVDLAAYTTVLVWCETFSEFITAAQYR